MRRSWQHWDVMWSIKKQISKLGQMNHLLGKFLSFGYKESLQQLAQLRTSKLWLSRTAEMNLPAGVSKLEMAYNKPSFFSTAQLWCESLHYHWQTKNEHRGFEVPPCLAVRGVPPSRPRMGSGFQQSTRKDCYLPGSLGWICDQRQYAIYVYIFVL